MAQHSESSVPLAIQETRTKVMAWLMQEGWQIGQQTVPDAAWLLTGQDISGRHIVVGQQAQSPDQIMIEGAVKVDQVHREGFAALPQAERVNFLWDLRFSLLQTGVEFGGVDDNPEQVSLQLRIYYDGLTKDAFLQRVGQVKSAVALVQWIFARKFLQPPPPQTSIERLAYFK